MARLYTNDASNVDIVEITRGCDPYDPTKDYCSMSPDEPFGVSIRWGGYIHDCMADKANKGEFDRDLSDRWFRAYIMRQFRRAKKPIRGRLVATLYYRMLQRFNPVYRWGQSAGLWK